MNKDKISSQEIIDLVAAKASVSKRAAEEFLKVMIGTIEEALLAGELVKIKNLGTFKLQWNEPRKSVNVQTGEEIIIAGYHKVSFVPDTLLKNLVNEPFAHLEPIELDSGNRAIETQKPDEVSDPLRIFTEQASEIKSLISEINALSEKNDKKEPEEEVVEIEADVIYEIPEEEDIDDSDDLIIVDEEFELLNKTEPEVVNESNDERLAVPENGIDSLSPMPVEPEVVSTENTEIQTPETENSEQIAHNELEMPSTSFTNETVTLNKKKRLLWIPILFILLFGSGFGLYYFYPPAYQLADKSLHKSKKYIVNWKENVSLTNMFNSVSNWINSQPKPLPAPETVVVPKDTTLSDSIFVKQPVDSLQLLFDNSRVYTEFIASERIKSGSRLTLMSRRYYGSKDFWVYIYEANKEKIPNPDQIAKGTLIRIPKLDARLIDVSNPRCLTKAKELHDLYVK